jgi:HPt (histidine-containing phosphotransfer) domain-containing protein/PAS domain-containing protein
VKRRRSDFRLAQVLPVATAIAFAAVLTTLLTFGIQRATQLQSASSALQLASELRALPQYFGTELTLVQRGLESRTFVGEPLQEISAAQAGVDTALTQIDRDLTAAGLGTNAEIQRVRGALDAAWGRFAPLLSNVTSHTDSPYSDTMQGSKLNSTGRNLKKAVDEALGAQSAAMRDVGGSLKDLAAGLQNAVGDRGRSLRTFLLIGALVSALLLTLMLYFALRSRRASEDARRAERQVTDILGTVREGLFLLDRNLSLGSVYSQSLTRILRTEQVRDMGFEDLLQPLVSGKTLATAMKFVNLLWKEKVHEDLIDSVNPLSQIEVRFERPNGGHEARHLSFAFKRVKGVDGGPGEFLLGIVTDVTDRVSLAKELEQSKADNQAQLDLMMQLLQMQPAALESFVRESDLALRKGNAILKQPGHEEGELRTKLNGVFREVHTMKGEAAGLGLASVAARIHQLEESLTAVRDKTKISGDDFIPIVVKIDELMSYLNGVGQFAERLGSSHPGGVAAKRDDSAGDTANSLMPPLLAQQVLVNPGPPLDQVLTQVVNEAATAHGKTVALQCRGLTDIPPSYRKAAQDIAIHMARNAVVHGVELPADRQAASKPQAGTVRVAFESAPDGYLLTIEDDGQGLAYERILDTALRKGLVSPADAARMERPAVYGLIFRPGFTTAERVSEHAGRGVGLDAVSHTIRQLGGSIGVSTADGKFTRFRMKLPQVAGGVATHAA